MSDVVAYQEAGLPGNAWLCHISSNRLTIWTGDNVERRHDWAFEGAWAGPFTKEGLSNAAYRFGSGFIIEPGEIRFLAPTHSLEALYIWRGRSRVAASNSLHLLLASVPESHGFDMAPVRGRAHSKTKGRAACNRILFANANGTMLQMTFGTARIDRDSLAICEDLVLSSGPPPFSDFNSYRNLLLVTVGATLQNARSELRTRPYRALVTSCSSGYDSPACAAIAVRLGCRESFTITTSRGGKSDSGAEVARSLGLVCHEYERFGTPNEVPGSNDYSVDVANVVPEHEVFLSSINEPEDLFFSSFTPHLDGAVILTGFHGGGAWDLECSSGPDLTRGDASGSSLDHFRLNTSFVNIPVPFIGVEHWSVLTAISKSAEMKPWRIGGGYDRPIPRRIAEEAGVPRQLFGQRKMAGSVLLASHRKLQDELFWKTVKGYSALFSAAGGRQTA